MSKVTHITNATARDEQAQYNLYYIIKHFDLVFVFLIILFKSTKTQKDEHEEDILFFIHLKDCYFASYMSNKIFIFFLQQQ